MEIRLEHLTKIFKSKLVDTVAVNDLDVIIESGKLVGLLGPSGCGKSTTLFMIAGLHNPTGGKIFFGDDDVTRLSADKRGIGLVFQNYALYPHMTVRQNIMFPLENLNISPAEAEERTAEMAKLVGIGNLLDRKPAQLSGGQQQRVAIARALVKRPRVLLLDEPLSNLDARLRLQMREEIKRIQRETGITTIFVTHDQEEAMSISDQIIILNFGKEMQRGKPQDIYNSPDNLFVAKFLGNPPINVFRGTIKKNVLYCGNVKLVNKKAPDGEYEVGIRPEDFKVTLDDNSFEVKFDEKDIIGRDTMIRFRLGSEPIRALVESDDVYDKHEVKFTVKEEKVHLFDLETEIEIRKIDKYTEAQKEDMKQEIARQREIKSSETEQTDEPKVKKAKSKKKRG